MENLHGTFEFSNLGRQKVNKTVQLTGEKSLFAAIKPHLMSQDIDYEYDTETKTGKIFVGFRHVGDFRLAGPTQAETTVKE